MGALYNGVCHVDSASAMQAMVFSPAFAHITPGSTTYYTLPVMIGANANIQFRQISSTGVDTAKYTVAVPVTLFPSCDPSQSFSDGLAMGWLIAGLMISAFCINLIRKQVGR